jgi:hypothetical protein
VHSGHSASGPNGASAIKEGALTLEAKICPSSNLEVFNQDGSPRDAANKKLHISLQDATRSWFDAATTE